MDKWTVDKLNKKMNPHSYKLQPYAGVQTRHTCPSCGRKRCFTRYIDEIGDTLNDNVGRCDHESSCGYHYSPSDYFRDHPDTIPRESSWLNHPFQNPHKQPKPQRPLCTIPMNIVYITGHSAFAGCPFYVSPCVTGDRFLDTLRLTRVCHRGQVP